MNPDLPGGSSGGLENRLIAHYLKAKAIFVIDPGCVTLKGHANHPSEPLMLILNVIEL